LAYKNLTVKSPQNKFSITKALKMQTKICKFSVFCFIYDIDSSNYQDENIFPKIKPPHQVAICAKGYKQKGA
jgi:hypothetical protein